MCLPSSREGSSSNPRKEPNAPPHPIWLTRVRSNIDFAPSNSCSSPLPSAFIPSTLIPLTCSMASNSQRRSKLRPRIASLPHLSAWRLLRPHRLTRQPIAVDEYCPEARSLAQETSLDKAPLDKTPLDKTPLRRSSWLSFSSTRRPKPKSQSVHLKHSTPGLIRQDTAAGPQDQGKS